MQQETDKYAEIKRLLRQLVGFVPNLPIIGTVKSVKDDYCSVELIGGLVLEDVKLKATIGNEEYLKLIPKVDTSVVMLSLDGSLNNLTVIKMDEVEKVEYKQNDLEIIADSTDKKVSVKNDNCSLLEVMQDLSELLKDLKVFTAVGASGIPLPATQAKITQFENKFKSILK